MELQEFVTHRLEELTQRMKTRGVDGFFCFSSSNRHYLSGFTGSFGYLLVTAAGDRIFFTDWRYTDQARQQTPGFEVVELFKDKHLWTPLKSKLEELNVARVGYEASHVSAKWLQDAQSNLPQMEWVATEKLVEDMRVIKDDFEIASLRRAQEIADQVFSEILSQIKPGVSERKIAVTMRHRIEQLGADNLPTMPIIASGWRAALPHGRASDKQIALGEFVLFDFGAMVNGYRSDMTRTVVCGKATERHREIYDLVRSVQEDAAQLMQDGVTGREVDHAARQPLIDAGYGNHTHGYSVGHGIGLDMHEDPFMSEGYAKPLEAGMVITIEPGVYIPGWGGVRIEDTVLIQEGENTIFDAFTRDLLEV